MVVLDTQCLVFSFLHILMRCLLAGHLSALHLNITCDVTELLTHCCGLVLLSVCFTCWLANPSLRRSMKGSLHFVREFGARCVRSKLANEAASFPGIGTSETCTIGACYLEYKALKFCMKAMVQEKHLL